MNPVKWALVILIAVNAVCSSAQQVEWADVVIDYSSQKSDKLFSAQQILGKPNKMPVTGHSSCTWSPAYAPERHSEYIHVGFNQPLVAQQIIIAENFYPGHVKEIYIYDSLRNGKLIYTKTIAEEIQVTGRLLSVLLSGNKTKISSIKLVLDEQDQFQFYQIDAIGITTSTQPITLSIYEIEEMKNAVPENLGTGINSEFDEVYPIISPDGNTLYFDRKLHPANTGTGKLDDIWLAERTGNTWSTPVSVGAPLNNQDANFLCSISPDGNLALLGGSYATAGSEAGVSLAYQTDKGWGNPKSVVIRNFKSNSPYNEFSLAPDGTTLLMAIGTADGYGLGDLYVSFMMGDGNFSQPKNLGGILNTAGNEMSPILAADGKTLYFSSNGFAGYGSQDIFMAKRLDDSWTNWTEPVNMGNAINSPEWEAYYSIDAKGEYAYFSSSYTSKTNLDIFRVKLPPQAQPENIVWMKGNIADRSTGKIITAKIETYNLNDSLLVGYSNSTITSNYSILLQQEHVYRVRITSENYFVADTVISIDRVEDFTEVTRNFSLIPKTIGVIIEMKNILFDPNSALLKDTSSAELDKLVVFMQQNPAVAIEIRGHTNSLCDDDYCNSLSLRRAEAVMAYISSKGIATSRMTAKGYGKTVPVADNKTAEGRQKNQRVEFMITRVE